MPRPSLLVGALFEHRTYASDHTTLDGGRLFARTRLGDLPFEMGVDVGAATGASSDPLGSVDILVADAGIGIAHLSNVGSAVVSLGVGVSTGYANVRAEPASRAVAAGRGAFVLFPALDLGLRLPTVAGFWLTADALGGPGARPDDRCYGLMLWVENGISWH